MRLSEGAIDVMVANSPFWYWDGWVPCNFVIDPTAEMREDGKFNRDLGAWGFERCGEIDKEGFWNFE